jgi:hypothetical protein
MIQDGLIYGTTSHKTFVNGCMMPFTIFQSKSLRMLRDMGFTWFLERRVNNNSEIGKILLLLHNFFSKIVITATISCNHVFSF